MKTGERGNVSASIQFILEKKISTQMCILDIGCNLGSLVNDLSRLGYNSSFGIDVNDSAIMRGINKYPYLRNRLLAYDGTEFPFADKSFDNIVSFDVIEHIPDLNKHFREVNRMLKPNGLYIFQTPNKRVNVPWEIIYYRSLSKWKDHHYSLQTPGSLKRLINNNGLRLLSIEKRPLDNEYNIQKVRKQFGIFGLPLLKAFNHAPKFIFPHMWGVACKLSDY